MPAFIELATTEDVELDGCYCPGQPHPRDTITIRTEYGYGDVLELARVHTHGRIDPMGERAKLLELAIVRWSFVDDGGAPVPVDMPHILRLRQGLVEPIVLRVDEHYERSRSAVPNGSGGPSAPSSPARVPASLNRAQRRAAKRSTPRSSSAPAGPTPS